MQKASYNATSNAHKLHQHKAIQLHNQTHKSYYLKPLGRYTLALLFILLAILSACIAPEAGEGSVFLVLVAIIVLATKRIKINLWNGKQKEGIKWNVKMLYTEAKQKTQ